jgi:PAS domain S-box-containing protein
MKKIFHHLDLSERFLLSFVLCALIPMTIVFLLWFSELRKELRNQAFQVLRHETKTISVSVMEKLRHVEAEMRFWVSSDLDLLQKSGTFDDSSYSRGRFVNVIHAKPDSLTNLLENKKEGPGIQSTVQTAASLKRPSLLQKKIPDALPQVEIVFPVSESEWLHAHINPAYLFNEETNFNLPPYTELSILGPDETVLFSTIKDSANLIRALLMSEENNNRSAFTWDTQDETYVASAYRLFTESLFDGDPWTIILSRPEKSFFGPVDRLQLTLILAGLLIVLISILLSSLSIRRNLNPLNTLVDYANKLGKGDFSEMADLDASPEIKKLSVALSSMAEKIEKQFAQLRESEERFRGLVETSADRIWETGADGKYTYTSSKVRDLLGYEPHEVIGRRPSHFMAPGEKERLAAEFARIEAEKRPFYDLENVCLHKDGRRVILETSGLRRLDSKGVYLGYRGIDRDITERKSAEETLRESENRFRASFEEAPAGMGLFNENGELLKVNKAFSEMVGYTQAELTSKCLYELIDPEGTRVGGHRRESVLDLGVVNKAVETRLFRRGGGGPLVGLVNTSPLEGCFKAGRLHIIHIQDITMAKNAQIEKQELEAQLHHAQKMEAIGTLAAGIAHDFNNILSVISGNAEIAMLDLKPDTPVNAYLENILQGCQRASGLTKQILSFSRSDKDEMSPVQLNMMVKETAKLLRSSIPPHINIIQEISSQPYMVMANPTQMHQLIMNLCTNSYHALMAQDTGTIRISLNPQVVRLPKESEAKTCLKLRISDTGCGMSPEIMKRIFEPYFTTKEKGKGTGLGLSIAYSVVAKHGGAIKVESEVGRGTSFTIHFPIVDQQMESISQSAQSVSHGSESVLIVDDEEAIAKTWEGMLKRQGYDVVVRSRPSDALEEFKRSPERFSLVISDLAMPGMTGDCLCQEIFKIRPEVPIIMCTGYFETLRSKTICSSIKQILIKPVSLGALTETVRRVIDGSTEAIAS